MKQQPFFSIVYEDENIIAVNKISGLSVGGERWEESAQRLDRLLAGGDRAKLYTVHRIDKETSGLVVFAKNAETHKQLSAAFESRRVEKTYTAIIHGRPAWPGGRTECALPLFPDGNKKHLTIIDKYRGKPSQTNFSLLLSAGNYSIVEARPLTGRTHQIRVHLAALGHPVVCDLLYGKKTRGGEGVYLSSFKRNWRGDAHEEKPLLLRLGLHAAKLVLPGPAVFSSGAPHPGAQGETGCNEAGLCLEAPLPRDMAALVKQMEKVGMAPVPLPSLALLPSMSFSSWN
ncbi:MAG: RluA family pseudouridine synthase [Treponema sp.]|jgi:RluA family pseudouridine synthase|nr:RluA family pseudouridine synthase [Treponema sp.]